MKVGISVVLNCWGKILKRVLRKLILFSKSIGKLSIGVFIRKALRMNCNFQATEVRDLY